MPYRLSYTSFATNWFNPCSLRFLIEDSATRNWITDITGALAYENGCFAQTLEGPKPEVLDLMDRLYLDPRHRGLEIVEARVVDYRLYREFGLCLMERDRACRLLHLA